MLTSSNTVCKEWLHVNVIICVFCSQLIFLCLIETPMGCKIKTQISFIYFVIYTDVLVSCWRSAEVQPLSALILKMSHFHPGLVLMLGRLDLCVRSVVVSPWTVTLSLMDTSSSWIMLLSSGKKKAINVIRGIQVVSWPHLMSLMLLNLDPTNCNPNSWHRPTNHFIHLPSPWNRLIRPREILAYSRLVGVVPLPGSFLWNVEILSLLNRPELLWSSIPDHVSSFRFQLFELVLIRFSWWFWQ